MAGIVASVGQSNLRFVGTDVVTKARFDLLLAWLSQPIRVDECENRAVAAALGAVAAPLVFGLIAAGHELFTGATGLSPVSIALAYPMTLVLHSLAFSVLIGIPYVLIYDRFIAGPRGWFILGATLLATAVGGYLYGWPGLFALASATNASVFAALIRPRQ